MKTQTASVHSRTRPMSVSRPTADSYVKVAAQARSGAVIAWGIWGAIWAFIAIKAWAQWILSDSAFGPPPILPGDEFGASHLIALRCVEAISTMVLVGCAWFSLIRPWLKDRKFTLDGRLLIGGIFGFCADSLLNLHENLFAFNTYSVNLGVWTSFMPFYTGGPYRAAESLLWGFPMYVYFGLGASWVGCALIARLRRMVPDISDASAHAILFVIFVAGDFLIENLIIRTSQAYVYPKTYGPMTSFAGSIYQFPFYESLLVGVVCWSFTMLRQSALDDPNGLSFVERGLHRVSPAGRPMIRTLAVIGACAAIFIVGYHLPFNWLGVVGSSITHLPSYLITH